jgi:hypothetical protein
LHFGRCRWFDVGQCWANCTWRRVCFADVG